MNQIEQDIKNKQLHNFYLLYGEEDYLKNKYANLLIKNIVENKDSMNYSYYEDRDIDSNDVIGTAITLPFFADKRIIHIKNSNWFKSPNEDFNNYLNEICDSTIFVFVENAVDKRSKAFKALSKEGVVLELGMPNNNDIRTWIGNKLKAENKSMEREAYQEFVIRTDSNMENMDKEFEKLICYIGDNDTITLQDVEEICTKQIQSKVFDMINGIAEKNPKKVLDMYHDLLASKEPPIKILILIQRQFRRSLQIKDLREQGYSDDRIAKELKVQNFIIGKELKMTRNFSTATMNNLLEDACNLERDIKTGNIKDQLAVELLMMRYAS